MSEQFPSETFGWLCEKAIQFEGSINLSLFMTALLAEKCGTQAVR
jgi:hypothetical protein